MGSRPTNPRDPTLINSLSRICLSIRISRCLPTCLTRSKRETNHLRIIIRARLAAYKKSHQTVSSMNLQTKIETNRRLEAPGENWCPSDRNLWSISPPNIIRMTIACSYRSQCPRSSRTSRPNCSSAFHSSLSPTLLSSSIGNRRGPKSTSKREKRPEITK